MHKFCISFTKFNIEPSVHHFWYFSTCISANGIQWLKLHLVCWNDKHDIHGFWDDVLLDLSGVNPFKCLAEFVPTVISLPHLNAEVGKNIQ